MLSVGVTQKENNPNSVYDDDDDNNYDKNQSRSNTSICSPSFKIGQNVEVMPRTWPGINKPGGVGNVLKLHYSSEGYITSVDVKYLVASGVDTNIEVEFVKPHEFLGRSKRSRKVDVKMNISSSSTDSANNDNNNTKQKRKKRRQDSNSRNENNTKPIEKEDDNGRGLLRIAKRRTNNQTIMVNETTSKSKQVKAKNLLARDETEKTTVEKKISTATTKRVTNSSINKSVNSSKTTYKTNSKEKQNKCAPKATSLIPRSTKITLDISTGITNVTSNTNKTIHRKIISKESDKVASCRSISSSSKNLQRKQTDKKLLKIPLEQVYNKELKKAKDFVSSVVGIGEVIPREELIASPSKGNSSRKIINNDIHKTTDDTTEKNIDNDKRKEVFMSLFSTLINEKYDGEINIDDIINEINSKNSPHPCKNQQQQHTTMLFTSGEIRHYLNILENDENKIMISNNRVYSLDV